MKPVPSPEEGMMNHGTRVMRRRRRAWPPAARAAAAIIAAAAVALLAAACSSPSSAGSAGSSNAGGSSAGSGGPSLLAFAQCMRSKGLTNFPDPSSNSKFPSAQQLGVSGSQYQAAQNACQNLLPAGPGRQFSAAEVQQLLVGMRAFSQCMRSHGVANWPDPSTDSQGQPQFDITSAGITSSDRRSPQVQTAMSTCQHLLPSALGPGDPPLN
jgi:hypothetical protein